jgi:sodium/proline symporter
MMSREQYVLGALVAYHLVLVAIGLLSQRRTHDGVDYFLAGRSLGPWVAALSASASSSSAWTLLGVSGAAYAWGLSAIWLFPACVGGFLLNWYVLAPRLQRLSHASGAITVTEVLSGRPDHRLHRAIVVVASLIILLSLGGYVAAQFQGAGKAFSESFGLPLVTSLLIGAGVVVFYTLIGGFWAVSLTDSLQGVMMALTAILLPVAALVAVGGFGALGSALAALGDSGYLSLTQNLAPAAAVGFVLGIFGIGLGYPGQPHVVNRFMALRMDGTSVQIARRVAIGWAVIVYAGMLILGFCGRVLYPGVADREVIFITATNELFHPIIAGIMISAVLSAIMSTADSQLLVGASTVTHDLKLGGGSQQRLLSRSRVVVLLLSIGAILAALYGSQEIYSRVLFAWTAMGAAFGPLLLMRVLRGPIPSINTLAAMLIGFGSSVAAYSFPETRGTAIERVVPFVLALIVILLPLGGRPREEPAPE